MNKDLMYLVRKEYEHMLEEIAQDVDDTRDIYDLLNEAINNEISLTMNVESVLETIEGFDGFNNNLIQKLKNVQKYGNPYLDFVDRVFNNVGIATHLSYREYMHDPELYEKALKLFSWLICGNRGTDVDYNTFADFMNKPE